MDEFEIKKLDKFEDNKQKVIQYNQEIAKYNESIEDPAERKTKKSPHTLQHIFNPLNPTIKPLACKRAAIFPPHPLRR